MHRNQTSLTLISKMFFVFTFCHQDMNLFLFLLLLLMGRNGKFGKVIVTLKLFKAFMLTAFHFNIHEHICVRPEGSLVQTHFI